MKKKVLVLITVVILAAAAIFRFVLWNNTRFLFIVASGLDRPSKTYYSVLERIYYLSTKTDPKADILKSLGEKEAPSNAALLIHVLGIADGQVPTGLLIAMYTRYQGDPNNQALLGEIIDCMGALGNNEFVPFLVRLLNDHKRLNTGVTRYAILRALYLITGETQVFGQYVDRKEPLLVTRELLNGRKVIMASRKRSRTFREMIVLDKLFRPPGW